MMDALTWIGGVLAVLGIGHFAASWAERRGWIYYRKPPTGRAGVALSNAMTEFEALVNPAAEHRLEEDRSQRILRSDHPALVGSGRRRGVWRRPGRKTPQ